MDPALQTAWETRVPASRFSGWLRVAASGLVMESRGLGLTVAVEGDDLSVGKLASWWRRLKSEGCAVQRTGSVRVYGESDSGRDVWDVHVTWASDEEMIAQNLAQASREKDALIRFSRSLLHSSFLNLVAMSAAQSLRACLDLTGCLIWVKEDAGADFLLSASVGVERSLAAAIGRLEPSGPPCSAWLASVQGKRLFLDRLDRSALCLDVEGRMTGGLGGSVYVTPLITSTGTVGVLELIGRRADPSLASQLLLLDQMAGMLALAVDRAVAFEKVERQASFDSLTGIANHRTMQDFLRGRLAECSRQGQSLAAVMIDVDFFRGFNEREGHEEGDKVLKDVAEALTRSIRAYDLAARYGGEEFALILPGATRQEAVKAAERVRQAVADLPSRGAGTVTVSCGVALFPDAAEDAPSLLKAADSALYQAKRMGRNKVCLYGAEEGAIVRGADLGAAVLACLTDAQKDEALRALERAEPLLQSLAQNLGLRVGHVDILIGAVSAWQAWISPEPPAALLLEVSAGDLRALEPVLKAGAEGLTEGCGALEEAFTVLLKALSHPSPSSRSEDAA